MGSFLISRDIELVSFTICIRHISYTRSSIPVQPPARVDITVLDLPICNRQIVLTVPFFRLVTPPTLRKLHIKGQFLAVNWIVIVFPVSRRQLGTMEVQFPTTAGASGGWTEREDYTQSYLKFCRKGYKNNETVSDMLLTENSSLPSVAHKSLLLWTQWQRMRFQINSSQQVNQNWSWILITFASISRYPLLVVSNINSCAIGDRWTTSWWLWEHPENN